MYIHKHCMLVNNTCISCIYIYIQYNNMHFMQFNYMYITIFLVVMVMHFINQMDGKMKWVLNVNHSIGTKREVMVWIEEYKKHSTKNVRQNSISAIGWKNFPTHNGFEHIHLGNSSRMFLIKHYSIYNVCN